MIFIIHSFQINMSRMQIRENGLAGKKKGFNLGRMTYIHPAAVELYFLRMLLNHVKGASSFEDLRKVSGVVYPSFQLACKALGMLGDDKE